MSLYCINERIPIFKNHNEKDLTPRITRAKNVKIGDSPAAQILNLEFYCFVDQRVTLENKINKIEMFLSRKNIDQYRREYSPFDNVDIKNQNDVNDLLYDYTYVMQDLVAGNQRGLHKLTEVDPYQRMRSKVKILSAPIAKQSDIELFGVRKEYKLKRKRRNTRFLSNRERKLKFLNSTVIEEGSHGQNFERKFRRQYNKSVRQGIDPMIYLQESDNYVTVEEMAKGVSKIIKPRKSRLRRNFKKYIQSSALNTHDLDFEIIESKVSRRVARLKARVRMNSVLLLGLLNAGLTNVIVFAYDKDGNRIDSYGYEIDIAKIFDDFLNPILDFDIFSSRNRRGNVNTKVSNDEFNMGTFNLYQKVLNHNQRGTESNFKQNLSFTLIAPRKSINLINGTTTKTQGIPIRNKTKSVFNRVTFNYKGQEIANTKASSVRAAERPAKQINCKVIARCEPENGGISVRAYDFSESVSSFQVVKRKVKGNRSNDFKPVQELIGNSLIDHPRQFFVEGQSKKAGQTFFDNDVEDEVIYEYGAILYDSSGAKHVATNRFFEEYVQKDNIVEATMRSLGGNLAPGDDNFGNTVVTESFEVILDRKEDDVDKIINSLFGDNRVLFNEDLAQIKDASNLLYGIRVHRIDLSTGESSHVGSFRAFKQQTKDEQPDTDIPKTFRVIFKDTLPAYSRQIYKIEPYVIPPAHVLDKVAEKIKLAATKSASSNSTLNRLLLSKMKILNKNKVSQIGSKYASNKRKKGRISSHQSFIEINKGDLFREGHTGDIIYQSHRPMTEIPPFDAIDLSTSNVSQFFALDRVKRESRFISKNFIRLNFQVDQMDHLVDFYVVLRAENNKSMPVIDGVIHSIDDSIGKTPSSYTYLSETNTRVGYLRYYLVAVSKIGQLSGFLTVGDIYLRN